MPFDSGLSVLAWAQERHDNSVQIASTKTGSDRVGWQEDVTGLRIMMWLLILLLWWIVSTVLDHWLE